MQTWFHLFVDDFYDRWANIKFSWRFTIAHIDCRQIFSINMKATGGSLVTLVSWLGSFAISYSFSFLMDWSSAGNCSPAILDVLFFLFGKRKNNVYEICLVRSKLSALLTEEAWNCNAVMYTSCLHFFYCVQVPSSCSLQPAWSLYSSWRSWSLKPKEGH